jgi:AP endonuclease-2
VRGSDHCPIYIELHDEIVSPSTGESIPLFEPEHFTSAKVSPRICAKNWPEFSKAQKLLSTFFGKKALEAANATPTSVESTLPIATIVATEPIADQTEFVGVAEVEPSPSTPSSNLPASQTNASETSSNGLKRKRDTEKESSKVPPAAARRGTSSKPKPRPGQASINSFFQPPASEKKTKPSKLSKSKTSKSASQSSFTSAIQSQTPTPTPLDPQEEPDLEADLELARRLAEEDALEESTRPADLEHKKSWSKLFVKYDTPKCEVHGEPCKELATTKPGPNKGRYFWICSRYVES